MEIQFQTDKVVIMGDEGRVSIALGKHPGSCNGKPYYVRSLGTQSPTEKEFPYAGQAIEYLAAQVSHLWARESVREFAKLPAIKKKNFLIQMLTGEV